MEALEVPEERVLFECPAEYADAPGDPVAVNELVQVSRDCYTRLLGG
jgi:hypothetical protein